MTGLRGAWRRLVRLAVIGSVAFGAIVVVGIAAGEATAQDGRFAVDATPTLSPSPGSSATVSPTNQPTPSTTPDESPTETSSPKPTSTASPGESTSQSEPASPSPSATKTDKPSRPASKPAAQTSNIPLLSVAIAILVLLAVAVVLRVVYRRADEDLEASPDALRSEVLSQADDGPLDMMSWRDADPAAGLSPVPSLEGVPDVTMTFLVELGEAMTDSNDPVTRVQLTLDKVARVNGVQDAEFIVFPTALMISMPGEGSVQTAVAATGSNPLRLDQVDAIYRVVTGATRREISPAEGLTRLRAARRLPAPFSMRARLLGYVIQTLGIALLLGASWTDLLVAACLGAAVGAARLVLARVSQPYQVFLLLASTFVVSVVVFLLGRTNWDIGVLAPLVSPLVTFLPGALLTTAVIELATGQMIAGAGRLAAGTMQLVLLAVGILAGAQLVGVPGASLDKVAHHGLGDLAPWIGVALFGIGLVINQCARRDALGWIVLVLYAAYAGQVIGGLFLGTQLSAFIGALVMTPVAMFVARQRSGPPLLVSFLPAFWLLVPGALGLVGVTSLLGNDRVDGMSALVTTGATMIGIALGLLMGLAVGSSGFAFVDRHRRGGRR